MRIGVLTGGGDVPGLNSAVAGLVEEATTRGWEVLGIRRGWRGLLNFNRDDESDRVEWIVPLSRSEVRQVSRHGGTFLHTSRTNPANVQKANIPGFLQGSPDIVLKDGATDLYDCTAHVMKNIEHLGLDVLVPIGGDDTLSYGERLYNEGLNIIGIPKTMDNDVHGTDYCLGFWTCVNRCVNYINQLRTSTGSHERLAVIEIMGRNAGFSSLIPAYIAQADRAIIAEVPFSPERLAELLLKDKRNNPSQYAMVTISEGAIIQGGDVVESGEADAYGHRKLGGIGYITGELLKKLTGEGIVYQPLGYLVRSGPPDPFDVMVTFNFANLAVELMEKKKFGQLVRIWDGHYGYAPLSVLSEGLRRVDVDALYDVDEYRPDVKTVLGAPMFLGSKGAPTL